jgi:hypothetical protein
VPVPTSAVLPAPTPITIDAAPAAALHATAAYDTFSAARRSRSELTLGRYRQVAA